MNVNSGGKMNGMTDAQFAILLKSYVKQLRDVEASVSAEIQESCPDLDMTMMGNLDAFIEEMEDDIKLLEAAVRSGGTLSDN